MGEPDTERRRPVSPSPGTRKAVPAVGRPQYLESWCQQRHTNAEPHGWLGNGGEGLSGTAPARRDRRSRLMPGIRPLGTTASGNPGAGARHRIGTGGGNTGAAGTSTGLAGCICTTGGKGEGQGRDADEFANHYCLVLAMGPAGDRDRLQNHVSLRPWHPERLRANWVAATVTPKVHLGGGASRMEFPIPARAHSVRHGSRNAL